MKYISQLEKILPKAIVLDISSMGTEFDMNSGEYVEKAKNKTILTKGWEFRDEKNLKKHSETLRHFFTPVDGYKHIVRQIFLNLRSQFDCIIGVHIRKGDYRGWEGGKYFFSDEVYLNRMEGLNREVTEQGKTCCFFICSNEAVNQTLFANLNTNIEQRHAMVDLYCLAECDYIMGPPSTFSFWASFYGNKPIHTIKNMNEAIALDAFSHYYK
ncbi:MAG TPA: alpha-1,2-fucosyltransferase [Mucilaginibacter sp.]